MLGCVEPSARQTTSLLQLGERIVAGGPAERLAAWVDFYGELDVDVNWLELQLGIASSDVDSTIQAAIDAGWVQMPQQGRLVSPTAAERIRRFVLKLLTHQAEATEKAWLVEEAVLERARSAGSPQAVRPVIDQLVRDQELVRVNEMVAVASQENVLSKKQRARMDQILTMFGGSRTPPTIKEVAKELGTTIDTVTSLVRFATQQQVVIDLGKGFFIAHDTFRELCGELRELFARSPEQSVANIRDHWQITRKHAIPLLEYCDRIAVTLRQGDSRVAGPGLDKMLSERL